MRSHVEFSEEEREREWWAGSRGGRCGRRNKNERKRDETSYALLSSARSVKLFTMQQQGKKNPSPRSILSFFSPGRVAEVSLSENYVSLDDETSIPWHGSSPSWPKAPAKPPAPKAKPLPKKPAPAPAPAQANWLVEKIKHLSLTGLLEKATNAECYELTKEKVLENFACFAHPLLLFSFFFWKTNTVFFLTSSLIFT